LSIFKKPVHAVSPSAKALLRLLWFIFGIYRFFYRGKHPRSFEENPATMRLADVAYLGYKYYYQSPLIPKEIIAHFKNHKWEASPVEEKEIEATQRIHFGGDLMPYKDINPEQCKGLWDEAGSLFFNADTVFANLETPLDPSLEPVYVPEMMLNDMLFNSSPQQFEIFNGFGQFKGLDIVSIANNHTLDQGIKGIEASKAFLQSKNIKTVGVANPGEKESDTLIHTHHGITSGWLAFTYCTNKQTIPRGKEYILAKTNLNSPTFDPSYIIQKAKKVRARGANFIILSLHMGNAYQAMPDEIIIQNIQKLVNSEYVDLIVGTHPHLPQAMASYESPKGKKVPVIYSLGDFVAWDIYTFSHLSQILQVDIVKTATEVRIQKIQVETLFMHRNKSHQLQFIPIKKLIDNQEFYEKTACFPTEIEKNIRYYLEYLAPYNP
jgi:hypothetical protein